MQAWLNGSTVDSLGGVYLNFWEPQVVWSVTSANGGCTALTIFQCCSSFFVDKCEKTAKRELTTWRYLFIYQLRRKVYNWLISETLKDLYFEILRADNAGRAQPPCAKQGSLV